MRQTSATAYRTIKENGLLSRRRFETYEVLFNEGPLTAGEVFERFRSAGQGHSVVKGSVCARITELSDCGVVRKVGTRKCGLTGHTAVLWDVTESLPVELKRVPASKCPTCQGSGKVIAQDVATLKRKASRETQGELWA